MQRIHDLVKAKHFIIYQKSVGAMSSDRRWEFTKSFWKISSLAAEKIGLKC